MAYTETLAARIREVIRGIDGEVTERKMFGGLAFMLNGHMFTGVVGDELMLRLGAAGAEAALQREHVREMDFTGRPMKAMVFVEPAGLEGDALGEWVASAAAFAQTLPPKSR
jgi:TfoX/Sxy family transcriptional regulator of competence genes